MAKSFRELFEEFKLEGDTMTMPDTDAERLMAMIQRQRPELPLYLRIRFDFGDPDLCLLDIGVPVCQGEIHVSPDGFLAVVMDPDKRCLLIATRVHTIFVGHPTANVADLHESVKQVLDRFGALSI